MDRIEPRSALGAYVRWRLKKEEEDHGRGYQAEVARRTTLSTAHVANILNRPHQGVGIDAATALARFWGMSFSELTDTATEWARTAPEATPTAPLPNLDDAIAFLRSRGEVSDKAIEAARRVGAQGFDFSPGVWIAILHDLMHPKSGAGAPSATPRRKRPAS